MSKFYCWLTHERLSFAWVQAVIFISCDWAVCKFHQESHVQKFWSRLLGLAGSTLFLKWRSNVQEPLSLRGQCLNGFNIQLVSTVDSKFKLINENYEIISRSYQFKFQDFGHRDSEQLVFSSTSWIIDCRSRLDRISILDKKLRSCWVQAETQGFAAMWSLMNRWSLQTRLCWLVDCCQYCKDSKFQCNPLRCFASIYEASSYFPRVDSSATPAVMKYQDDTSEHNTLIFKIQDSSLCLCGTS